MKLCRTIVAALVLVASVAGACADEPAKIKIGEFIPAAPPQPAPEIALTDPAGNPVTLADFKGKFVLVNLWATWCQPCLKEMPTLLALQDRLGPALTVLAVSEDHGGGASVTPFVVKLGLDKLKILLDPKAAASRAFGVRGLPSSFVIDGDGNIVGKVEGEAEWDSDAMRAALAKVLPAKPG
ncbi:MAG TPA: TlpA disulfide reductase family protein [Stellaceae bacterium]|jgi:thiol-disulfide isomerase/thioredoxin|nr:TlpA disulfide reductase family protein [Stellaceae bacterium]